MTHSVDNIFHGIMKLTIILVTVLAVNAIVPGYIEDAEDVKAAKAEFFKAFSAAEAGEHYLDNTPEVAEARKAFFAFYEKRKVLQDAQQVDKSVYFLSIIKENHTVVVQIEIRKMENLGV